jgi:hypothetical protein
MKTSVHRRLELLAGLLLLSLLVFATGIQAAQAAIVSGTGAGSGTTATPVTIQDGWLTAANTAARNQDVAQAVTAPASGAQTAAADTSSTTAWIAVGSAAAVLLVGFVAWALMRRRQPGEPASAAYCTQHPEDPLCSAV